MTLSGGTSLSHSATVVVEDGSDTYPRVLDPTGQLCLWAFELRGRGIDPLAVSILAQVPHRAGSTSAGNAASTSPTAAISDLANVRLQHMDAAAIDVQVSSHVIPTFRRLTPDEDLTIAESANDRAAAVTELDRASNELGFHGALINGRAARRFLDHPSLFPVLRRAAALNVPVYLHRDLPAPNTASRTLAPGSDHIGLPGVGAGELDGRMGHHRCGIRPCLSEQAYVSHHVPQRKERS
jgi:predicted TIM-barrel fold metal-dependent hydrolase